MDYKFTVLNQSEIDGKELSEKGWLMKGFEPMGEKVLILWEKDSKKEAVGQLNNFIDEYIKFELKKDNIDPKDEEAKKLIDEYIGPIKSLLSSLTDGE